MRTCRGRLQISRTAGPIALKFVTRLEAGEKVALPKSVGTHIARAHVQGAAPTSEERLCRLQSYLVHRKRPVGRVPCTEEPVALRVLTCARAHPSVISQERTDRLQ